MISQRDDAHVAEGLALLTGMYQGKPVTEAILTALLNKVQTLEVDVWDCIWGWVLEWLDPADPNNYFIPTGTALDDLGAIVGQPREGRIDEEYVDAIRLRARINRSKGRAEDVIQVAALLDEDATYVEHYPLGWEVSAYERDNGGDISRMLAQTKAASSYGVFLTSNFPEAEVFKFDRQPNSTYDFGSAQALGSAPKFPAALPTNPVYRRF